MSHLSKVETQAMVMEVARNHRKLQRNLLRKPQKPQKKLPSNQLVKRNQPVVNPQEKNRTCKGIKNALTNPRPSTSTKLNSVR